MPTKKLTAIGLTITVVYVGVVLLAVYLGRKEAASLPLNAWGDFIAGTTAPLVLIWIVIGYLQQGEELRLNTEALRAQQEQLRQQVAETAILAANSERQALAAEQMTAAAHGEAEAQRLRDLAESQPILKPAGGNQSGATYNTKVRNVGATITDVSASAEDSDVHFDIGPKHVLEGGGQGTITYQATRFPFYFTVRYKDKRGRDGVQRYQMQGAHVFKMGI